jgi:hypothetical protein
MGELNAETRASRPTRLQCGRSLASGQKPTARSKLQRNSISTRQALTTPQHVREVRAALTDLVCSDSTWASLCVATGVINAKGRRRGTGPWVKVHVYGAVALGRRGEGERSELVFVSTNEDACGFSGAEYAMKVRTLAQLRTSYIKRRLDDYKQITDNKKMAGNGHT